jgi:hypothetical protein
MSREEDAGGAPDSPNSTGRDGGKGALTTGREIAGAGGAVFGSGMEATGAEGTGSKFDPMEASCAGGADIALGASPGPSEGGPCGFEATVGAEAVKGSEISQAPAVAIKARATAPGRTWVKNRRDQ